MNNGFEVVPVTVHDPKASDSIPYSPVVRYALMKSGVVFLNGRGFGLLENMTAADHSSQDCRYLLRETVSEAWKDMPE